MNHTPNSALNRRNRCADWRANQDKTGVAALFRHSLILIRPTAILPECGFAHARCDLCHFVLCSREGRTRAREGRTRSHAVARGSKEAKQGDTISTPAAQGR